MMQSVRRLLIAIGIGAALAGGAQAAGDSAAGKVKFATCAGCHAIPGYTNAYPNYHVPRLGGQHPDYIVIALNAYRTGERQHPTMHANAFPMSEQDMRDIAAFLTGARTAAAPLPIRGDAAAGKAKSGTCVACHGADGNGNIPLYPRLAGQHEDYLRKSLTDYQSGARKNAVMKGMVAALSARDVADLAAYFASQPNGLTVVKSD
jgi:cytochrome c553